ncbi:hypothetical protein [Kaarinaea lacus]
MDKLRGIGAFLFVCLFLNPPVFAATVATIEISLTEDGKSQKKREIVTIDGDKARLDFLGESSKRTEQTPYLLTVDAGKSWVLGNTLKGKFYCANVDPVTFFKNIGEIVTEVMALVNPRVFEVKLDKIKEEPGPKILDLSTTHVRLVTTANAEATFMFKKYEYKLTITDDVWYTTKLEIQPFRKRWMEALTQSGYEKLDKLFADWAKKVPGPILKLESVVKLTNVRKNETDTQKEKAEITSIKAVKAEDLPKGTFSVPKCENINQKQLESTAKDMAKEGKLGL